VVIADHLGIGIGEDWERESAFAGEVARDFRRVDADRYGNDAGGLELVKLLLDASQLEGAEGSPVAAIENEQHSPVLFEEIRERHRFAGGIGQRKVRRWRAGTRSAAGRGDVSR
jgi:hypothetical protein